MKKTLKIRKLIKDCELEVLGGHKGVDYSVEVEMISRPQFEIMGNFEFSDPQRLMIIGVQESNFLDSQNEETRDKMIRGLFELKPPAIVFPVNKEVEKVLDLFREMGNEYDIPVLRSTLNTTPLNSMLYVYLHRELSETIGVHGVLMDIHGMGTLIIGASGIGKSETALELIKRGHILVSDDLVEIYESTAGSLIGTAPKILRRFLEIRGIGIVDVISMFGSGSYRDRKRVHMVVELEYWQKDKEYDRLGISTETVRYFNTDIPKITIPILPGRNIATLVESAATNEKLKQMGYNAAVTFTQNVSSLARGEYDDEEM
ncbi:MAG: HPr(Ser) kinase/phosphatase [Acholeplasmataceae bacterium]|jgi:HPr kinase/phosphorylase